MARKYTAGDFSKCIDALDQHELVPGSSLAKVAAQLQSRIEANTKRFKKNFPGYSDTEINKMVHEVSIDEVSRNFKELQQNEILNTEKRIALTKDLEKVKSQVKYLKDKIQAADRGGEGIAGMILNGRMQPFVDKFGNNFIGIDRIFNNNQPLLDEVAKGLWGDGNITPVAKGFADVYRGVKEDFANAFRGLGVNVPEFSNYTPPQVWSYKKVIDNGKDAWVAENLKRLDIPEVNKALKKNMTMDEVKEYMENIFDDMQRNYTGTDGEHMSTRTVGEKAGDSFKKKLFYKTADDYLYMQKRFGSGNMFSNIMAEVQKLSNELAILQNFGPDADANFRYVYSKAKEQLKNRKAKGRGKSAIDDPATSLEKQWDNLTGRANKVTNYKLAETSATIRSTLSTARLGGAFISSFADQANAQLMTNLIGSSYSRYLGNLVKVIFSGLRDADVARWERRTSTALERLSTSDRMHNRYDEFGTVGRMSKGANTMADVLYRISLLTGWTRAGKEATTLNFSKEIADFASSSWSDIPLKKRQTFEMFDLNEKDWNVIKKSVHDFSYSNGVKDHIIDPELIFKQNPETAVKYQAMMSETARMAVKEPSVEVRAMMNQGLKKGDVSRELFLSPLLQWKSFIITQTIDNLRTFLFDPRITNRWTAAANWSIYITLLGALSTAVKEKSKGRDVDVYSKEFLGKAIATAGIGGFASDVITSLSYVDTSKGQKNAVNQAMRQMAGPVYPFIFESVMLGYRALKGEKGVGYDAVNWLQNYTPGTSLWYRKQLTNDYIFNRLKQMADPKKYAKEQEFKKKLENNMGQKSNYLNENTDKMDVLWFRQVMADYDPKKLSKGSYSEPPDMLKVIFNKLLEKVGLENKVDFMVQNSGNKNAYSIGYSKENQRGTTGAVVLESGFLEDRKNLVEMIPELNKVITVLSHEIGHKINKNNKVGVPYNSKTMHESEFEADRIGKELSNSVGVPSSEYSENTFENTDADYTHPSAKERIKKLRGKK